MLRPDLGDAPDDEDAAADSKGLVVVIGLALLYCVAVVLPFSSVFDWTLSLTNALALPEVLHTIVGLLLVATPAVVLMALNYHFRAFEWRTEYWAVFFGIVAFARLIFGKGYGLTLLQALHYLKF